MQEDPITREAIVATNRLIGSRIRRTPIIEVDGDDFGLGSVRLFLPSKIQQANNACESEAHHAQ